MNLIDELKIEKDNLQVFNLRRNGTFINIGHLQEIRGYNSLIIINAKGLEFQGSEKIYAIDSGEYSTLLLAEEY